MVEGIGYHGRVIWACAKKEITIALTDRVFTVAALIVPLNVLILLSLFVLAGSNAPTAVVMNDRGPYAQAFYSAMSTAHSFRLQQASAAEAQALITAGQIVAVVTLPPDFDTRLQQNQPVQVDVEVNNLNTDFTNDIRRAVPLAITSFYARAFPHLVTVTPSEHDLYRQDTDYIPYLTVSILVVALMISGLLQAGTGAAREWELETMKGLLLSPAPRWAMLAGKMLGAFLLSLAAVGLLLGVLIGVVGVWPAHWDEVIAFTLLTLLIFIALGTLLGTLLQNRQAVTALALGTALPLFFLSGPFGPISFTTPLIQILAQLFPVYYAIVVQQHAFHDFTLNTYGLAINVAVLGGYALGFMGLATWVLRRSTVRH
ncbi:MAG TPA: ABC transporter permease [Chloroflexia bacterium]|nr:ABC transporter permease [Chloroflexia bacterium]